MAKGDKVGVCPRCGGDVVEGEKGYGCANWKESDGGCKFVIWKNSSGHDLTVEEVKQILEKGQTDEYLDFVSKKTGRPFKAKLLLDKDGQYSTKFEFQPRS